MTKRVLVTGGTRGLGLAICRRLAADGYGIVAVGRSESEELAALRRTSGGSVEFEPHDLADVGGVHALSTRVHRRLGPMYALVNNAAVGLDGVLGTQHEADIERALRVNLHAPILLTKYVSRQMATRRTGRIVNVSSIIAQTGFSGLSVYAATKAGLIGFTRSLARELGRAGITVNAVAPGYMETEMTAGLGPDELASIVRRSPLRRLARTEEVAGAVAYLLGDDAASVTGTVLTVDAGSTA